MARGAENTLCPKLSRQPLYCSDPPSPRVVLDLSRPCTLGDAWPRLRARVRTDWSRVWVRRGPRTHRAVLGSFLQEVESALCNPSAANRLSRAQQFLSVPENSRELRPALLPPHFCSPNRRDAPPYISWRYAGAIWSDRDRNYPGNKPTLSPGPTPPIQLPFQKATKTAPKTILAPSFRLSEGVR